MVNYKRVLTLTLGLFLLALFPLRADNMVTVPGLAANLAFSSGTLWVEDDRAAGYWRNGLSITHTNNKSKMYLDIDIAQLKSNLRRAEGFVSGYNGKFGFDTPLMGIDFSAGFFHHSFLEIEAANTVLSNNGGRSFHFELKMPVHIGKVNLTPSFLYGEGVWGEGSLYWFFGKPAIPDLRVYGLAAAYEQHSLNFHYASIDVGIINNQSAPLFDSCINAYTLYYTFSLERKSFDFTGRAGWLYAGAAIDGALTASNQHYALFPFLFYRINGDLEMHAAFALLDIKYKRPLLQSRLSLEAGASFGALHIFYGEGEAQIHSQMKKLFGGTETNEELPLKIDGLGAAFILLDTGLSDIPIGQRARLSLGLQKAFGVPWGYEQFLPDQGGASGASAPSGDGLAQLIKTVLLSGCSLYGTIHF